MSKLGIVKRFHIQTKHCKKIDFRLYKINLWIAQLLNDQRLGDFNQLFSWTCWAFEMCDRQDGRLARPSDTPSNSLSNDKTECHRKYFQNE